MYASCHECIQIRGECRDQRLALAGLHFGDAAVMHHDAADKLYVKVPELEAPAGRLAHGCKSLGQNILEALPRRDPVAKLMRPLPQVLIRKTLEFRLEAAYGFDNGP